MENLKKNLFIILKNKHNDKNWWLINSQKRIKEIKRNDMKRGIFKKGFSRDTLQGAIKSLVQQDVQQNVSVATVNVVC